MDEPLDNTRNQTEHKMGRKKITDLELPQHIRQASIPQQDRARHPCRDTNSPRQGLKQKPIGRNRNQSVRDLKRPEIER